MKKIIFSAVVISAVFMLSGISYCADNLPVGGSNIDSTGVSARDEILRERQSIIRGEEERSRSQAERLQSDQSRRDQLDSYQKGYELEKKRTEDYTGPSGLYDKALNPLSDPLDNISE